MQTIYDPRVYDPTMPIVDQFKESANYLIHLSFPQLTRHEIDKAIDFSIAKYIQDHEVTVHNNYKNTTQETTLLDITNWILDKKPIIASSGAMYERHGVMVNLIYNLLDGFINDRKAVKKEMFKYPKGSEMFSKFNMSQLLLKIDANGFYGCSGMYSCIFYNFYNAISTTMQAKSSNSAAALFFESFMNNNVPFGSFEELLQFVYNVVHEKRRFKDEEILDRDVTLDECFFKLIQSCGFGWVPTMSECEILYEMLQSLSSTDLNRLFYKNHLFSFTDNKKVKQAILYILCKLDAPFLNPNECPEEIKEELNMFYDLLYEYVYYDKQIIDRIEKMYSLVRSVSIVQDTDSCIICFDGWYNYILESTVNVPMKIKSTETDLIKACEGKMDEATKYAKVEDYDFLNDETITVDRMIDPLTIIPQDGLKYSIINILGYCGGRMVNDFMEKYCQNANCYRTDVPCLLVLKNEFTYYRLLILAAKKQYAGKLVLQEGNMVPEDKSLDIKGIDALRKTTINPTVQEKMKRVMFEDILSSRDIDQVAVLKHMVMIENGVRKSIENGEKIYYKPLKVKSISAYKNPMSMQGIKASIVYNGLHEPGTESLDLNTQNAVDIVKVDMNPKNIDRIKESNPYVYEKALEMFKSPDFEGGIDSVAIPFNEPIPSWVIPFVRTFEIINDNVGGFPLESIGLYRGSKNANHTNLIKF